MLHYSFMCPRLKMCFIVQCTRFSTYVRSIYTPIQTSKKIKLQKVSVMLCIYLGNVRVLIMSVIKL